MFGSLTEEELFRRQPSLGRRPFSGVPLTAGYPESFTSRDKTHIAVLQPCERCCVPLGKRFFNKQISRSLFNNSRRTVHLASDTDVVADDASHSEIFPGLALFSYDLRSIRMKDGDTKNDDHCRRFRKFTRENPKAPFRIVIILRILYDSQSCCQSIRHCSQRRVKVASSRCLVSPEFGKPPRSAVAFVRKLYRDGRMIFRFRGGLLEWARSVDSRESNREFSLGTVCHPQQRHGSWVGGGERSVVDEICCDKWGP